MSTKRIIFFAAIMLTLWIAWHLGLFSLFTLANLKAERGALDARYAAEPLVVIAAFFLAYVAVAAFHIPGAVGMLLSTIVYVNAGMRLAEIDQLPNIASPGLIASFVALALVPWVAKWVLRHVAAHRI